MKSIKVLTALGFTASVFAAPAARAASLSPDMRAFTREVCVNQGYVGTVCHMEQCWEVPGTVNAARGDVILSEAPASVIKSLLNSINQKFTHTGMALSSGQIRHNTMDDSKIDTVGGVIPDHLKTSGQYSLRDGYPGVVTQAVSRAWYEKQFTLANGLVLTGPSRLAFAREAAASQFESMTGWYRLYAYTDMNWKNPLVKATDDGNMCSGSVAWANRRAGNGGFITYNYDAATRLTAATKLHDEVKKHIIDGVTVFQNILLRDSRINSIAENISNQVVNCMAFNACGDTGTRWRDGVGEGNTLSPDNLRALKDLWIAAAAFFGTQNDFAYQSEKPLEITSRYFCCQPIISGNPYPQYTGCG